MLRVESAGSIRGFTEFEEDIHFDDDDPDFDHPQGRAAAAAAARMPFLFGVPASMSLAGVHPVELHSSHSSLATLSHSVDDVSSWSSQVEQVLTIEQLRDQLTSCFTCGVSWSDDHVSLDCTECGGYAMTRPCPTCDGACGTVFKRDFTMSHASNKARWLGECQKYPISKTASAPQATGEPKNSNGTKDQQQQQQRNVLIAQELSQRLEKLSANS